MSTRATINFKLNGKKLVEYTQHGSADRENIFEKINDLISQLKKSSVINRETVVEKVKILANTYDWELGQYGWGYYFHEVNIVEVGINKYDVVFSTYDTKKHSDSGTLECLLAKKLNKGYTHYKILENGLEIKKGNELLAYYPEKYQNKDLETVYTYTIFKKGKLIKSSKELLIIK